MSILRYLLGGSTSVQSQTIAATPAVSSVTGTMKSVVDDGSQTGGQVTEAQRLAYMFANDPSPDPAAATIATTLNDVDYLIGMKAGVPFRVPKSLVGAGGGSSGTTAVAPGQVGSLAAGTPTSTSVPLTWSTPNTGTAPFTYTVGARIHGSGSAYTSASGTFGATGGTVTGLTAATSYDFRVTVDNGTSPASTTDLTTGVSTAASSGGGAGALTMSGATYAARNDGSGKQMLANGTGTITGFTLPSNGRWVAKLKLRGGTQAQYAPTPVFKVSNANGDFIALALGYQNTTVVQDANGENSGASGTIADGAIHEIALEANLTSGYYTGYLDGVLNGQRGLSPLFGASSTLLVQCINIPTLVAGVFDLRVYDGTFASPGTLLAEWLLDSNGSRV